LVAITAPSPQTTRNTIRGIVSDHRGQLVFLDTPGYHDSEQKYNHYLKHVAETSLEDCDLVLYVVDSRGPLGPEDRKLLALISAGGKPVSVALNKVDLKPAHMEKLQAELADALPRSLIHPISALKGFGVKDLLAGLFLQAPDGEPFYPEDYYTDQDPEFRITEIIRGETVNRVRQELPHAVYVDIVDSEMVEERHLLKVRAVIYVERESQKGMIVGKKGGMIREIRLSAEKELAEIFPYKVALDLRVKVDPKWRSRDQQLKNLIF
jgi:GTP-binding protein Era